MVQTLSVQKQGTTLAGVATKNDIYLNREGNISISRDQDAVLQACSQVAQVLLGEVVLDTTVGIPYFETVWNGVPNVQQFQAALRNAFLSVEGVIEVVSLVTSQIDSVLTYNAIIRTIFGTGSITSG